MKAEAEKKGGKKKEKKEEGGITGRGIIMIRNEMEEEELISCGSI